MEQTQNVLNNHKLEIAILLLKRAKAAGSDTKTTVCKDAICIVAWNDSVLVHRQNSAPEQRPSSSGSAHIPSSVSVIPSVNELQLESN